MNRSNVWFKIDETAKIVWDNKTSEVFSIEDCARDGKPFTPWMVKNKERLCFEDFRGKFPFKNIMKVGEFDDVFMEMKDGMDVQEEELNIHAKKIAIENQCKIKMNVHCQSLKISNSSDCQIRGNSRLICLENVHDCDIEIDIENKSQIKLVNCSANRLKLTFKHQGKKNQKAQCHILELDSQNEWSVFNAGELRLVSLTDGQWSMHKKTMKTTERVWPKPKENVFVSEVIQMAKQSFTVMSNMDIQWQSKDASEFNLLDAMLISCIQIPMFVHDEELKACFDQEHKINLNELAFKWNHSSKQTMNELLDTYTNILKPIEDADLEWAAYDLLSAGSTTWNTKEWNRCIDFKRQYQSIINEKIDTFRQEIIENNEMALLNLVQHCANRLNKEKKIASSLFISLLQSSMVESIKDVQSKEKNNLMDKNQGIRRARQNNLIGFFNNEIQRSQSRPAWMNASFEEYSLNAFKLNPPSEVIENSHEKTKGLMGKNRNP